MKYWYYLEFGEVRDVEKVQPRTCHPKKELRLQMELYRHNTRISKLVQVTVKDLK